MKLFAKTSLVFLVSLFVACSDTSNKTEDSSSTNQDWLVKVNGDVISSEDLESAIERTVGELAAFQLDESGRQKVLESLVLSRAMADKQLSLMTEEEVASIDSQVKAYREELLAKLYLKNNLTPIPVTEEMVKEYYENNPDKFGGKTVRSYEVVKANSKVSGEARKKIMSSLSDIAKEPQWQDKVQQLKQQGFGVSYAKGAVTQGVLNSKVDSIIQGLPLQEASSVHFVDGIPMILRVVKEQKVSPKPLAEVRNDIRKSLAPIQLRKAVKKASKEILAEAKVVYHNDVDN
ncbi:peptidylprolyl isomerase [Pleionea sediminis]|uniref:peptidylprolyl isomerase n=1 Tax=Pleionea sediminis TaxID=2569479 RepID=UPI0011849D2B|nr:peptidylprolyl isomerase [Pleionea sediminis]